MNIVVGHHLHVVFGELLQDNDPHLDRMRENIEVIFAMKADGIPRSSVKVINKRRLLNTAYSKVLPLVDVSDVLGAVISYVRTFDECYQVPFCDEVYTTCTCRVRTPFRELNQRCTTERFD